MKLLLGLDAAWVALITTVIATIGVKLIERWLTKRDRSTSDAAQIRSELKEQVTDYKEEIRKLEDDADEWRGKYYATLEELVAKRIELQNALDNIQRLSANISRLSVEQAKKIMEIGPSESLDKETQ